MIAKRYCEKLESKQLGIADISYCFSGLYFTGLNVISSNNFKDDIDSPDLSDKIFLNTHKTYAELPALPFQYYKIFLSAYDIDESEEGMGDLYDDIIDVYHDLKVSIIYWEMGCKFTAVLYLTDTFSHWGEHIVWYLFAAHSYSNDFPEQFLKFQGEGCIKHDPAKHKSDDSVS